jgi:hypothetical protein
MYVLGGEKLVHRIPHSQNSVFKEMKADFYDRRLAMISLLLDGG